MGRMRFPWGDDEEVFKPERWLNNDVVFQPESPLKFNAFQAESLEGQKESVLIDYVLKVTSIKDQEQYWAHKDDPYRCISVKEFADAFQSFHVGCKIGDELSIPFDKSKSNPAALTTSKFGIRKMELLKACSSREWLLMKRNSFVYIFKMMQLIVIGFIAMTVFHRTKMHCDSLADGGIHMGALFFALVTVMFNGFFELSMTIAELPVFYKQSDRLLFYPAWAFSLPAWILKIPISFMEAVIWIFMTYYVIGFDPNVGRVSSYGKACH